MFTKIANATSDIFAVTRRNLVKYTRLPQLVVFSTIQPVMFMLLFTYVFGGAIKSNFHSYLAYLLPGIIVQTVLFGSVQTGVSLAEDMTRGMIDRFRSLPMAHSAVLAGRTLTDVVRNAFVIVLIVTVGLIIGYRIEHGLGAFLLAVVLTLLFGFAFSWVSATIGLLVKDVETAQVAGFVWIFPLVFASSIFVPIETMPTWLQAFAKNTPITATVNAVRALSLGQASGTYIWYALLWIAALLVFFVPVAVYAYNRKNS
jgi:ABC transporter DrrB family efflux protein